MPGRTPLLSPLRSSREPSVDHSAAPSEGLRRRLAAINGSSSLSQTHIYRDIRNSLFPSPASSSYLHAIIGLPSSLSRPSRPTESVISTSNSLTFRSGLPLHVGSTVGQKAIGSSKTNATGLLEAPFKMLSEGSPEQSDRSSPRGTQRHLLQLLLISTYDGHELGISNMLEHRYLRVRAASHSPYECFSLENFMRKYHPFLWRAKWAMKFRVSIMDHL